MSKENKQLVIISIAKKGTEPFLYIETKNSADIEEGIPYLKKNLPSFDPKVLMNDDNLASEIGHRIATRIAIIHHFSEHRRPMALAFYVTEEKGAPIFCADEIYYQNNTAKNHSFKISLKSHDLKKLPESNNLALEIGQKIFENLPMMN